VRALLIVNPHATSTTQLRRNVIVRALSSAMELEVVQTRYRGHATFLAADARKQDFDLVLTLGGDGTVNEAVNGILGPATADAPTGAADCVPALAALPGGNANVFTRALGLPLDAVDATGQILHSLAQGRPRTIGLGLAEGRYFTFNAGLGLDAEVVRAVEGGRALGKTASSALYLRMTTRQYFRLTDRRHPALTLEHRDQLSPEEPLFLAIVTNTAPWTYFGRRPINTTPRAAFDTGLDVFAMRSLRTVTALRAAGQLLSAAAREPHGRSILTLHDQSEITVRSGRPVAFQLDGEYVGEREYVRFLSVPHALRVIA
jgi:diacylglycerol kinase family enzyme